MKQVRILPWRAAVVAVALLGLALTPGSGLAQPDQGRGEQGGPQGQKQETPGARKAPPPRASGRQQAAPQPRTSGRPQAAPQPRTYSRPQTAPQPRTYSRPQTAPQPRAYSRPQTVPQPRAYSRPQTAPQPRTYGREQAVPQGAQPQPPAARGRGARAQQPAVSGAPTGRAQRNPYALYQSQPKPKPAPLQPGSPAQNTPRVSGPRPQTPQPTVMPQGAPPRRGSPAANRPMGVPRVPGGAAVTPTGGVPRMIRPQRPGRALAGMPPAVKTPPPTPISRQALTRPVPAPSFRGPQAERKLVAITPQIHQRGVQQLNGWVRQQNARAGLSGRGTSDWIGNPIPAGTPRLQPSNFTQINIHYTNIVNVFGEPRHDYLVLPRTGFYGGYFDESDGFYGYRHHEHSSFISISLFYPFYFSQPSWYAFSYPGFYPSVYSLYGWCPGWVYPDRVYYQPVDYVYAPAPYRPGTWLDVAGQQRAIDDLRQAWLDNDPSLFAAHLTDQLDIRIYFNGAYSYSSSTNDFYAMTADAMSTAQTASIDFDNPVWISSREVFVTGYQTFDDPSGSQRDLYLSYRLRKLGRDWYIVAFGTSPNPIQSHYTDFRY